LSGATGGSTSVEDIAVIGNDVVLGGHFTQVSGQSRRHLALVDALTGNPRVWTCHIGGRDAESVYALAASATHLIAGGNLQIAGGEPRDGLAALDRDSGTLTSWAPEILVTLDTRVPGTVNEILVDDTSVWVAEAFAT
jgi:hypothetical protein